jgi:hypothetical protein
MIVNDQPTSSSEPLLGKRVAEPPHHQPRRRCRRRAVEEVRVAQQPRGPLRPGQHRVAVGIGEQLRVGEAAFLQVPGAGRDAALGVEAELAEQEVEPVAREVARVPGGDRLRAGDAVQVGLLEAHELDLVGGDPGKDLVQIHTR